MAMTEAKTEAVINKRLVHGLYWLIGVFTTIVLYFGAGVVEDVRAIKEELIPNLSRDTTQQLNDLGNRVTGLQGELRSQASDISGIDGMMGDHETRLRALEAWRANVVTRTATPAP